MKILVIRLSSIGDIILTTPVLEALKKRYPDAQIDFLVMDTFKDAIEGVPLVDNLILFPKTAYRGLYGLFRFGQQLSQNRYDMVIDLHAQIRSIIICNRLNARVLRYRKRVWWKSMLVPLRLIKYKVDDTIVGNYFRPLSALGISHHDERFWFYFKKSDLQALPWEDDYVVLAPGAANETKKWLPEYFGQLGSLIKKKVLLIGGQAEFDTFENIRQIIGDRCLNMAGSLSLKESAAVISAAQYVVSNDSGPFHIARAVGTKVYVIFGPTDPGMFSYDNNAVLIYAYIECSPCSLHGDKKCPQGHFRCMKELTPEKVYATITGSQPAKADSGTSLDRKLL